MSVVFPINENDRYDRYVATSGQTAFAISFPFQDNRDIAAWKTVSGTRTALALTTDYTLSGAGNPAGGTLTLVLGASTDDIIEISGQAVLDRVTSVVAGGKFRSKSHDDEHDRHRIIQQELKRETDLALKQVPGGGEFDASGQKIANIANGTANTDAAAVGQIGDIAETAGTTAGTAAGAAAGQSAAIDLVNASAIDVIDGGGPLADYGPLALFDAIGPRVWYGTAANWASENPTLQQGEFALETDTRKLKIGDGATAYASLAYLPFGPAVTAVAALTPAANRLIGFTGSNSAELIAISTLGRTLLNVADAAAALTAIGAASSSALSSHIAQALVDSDVGTTAGKLVALDGSARLPAVDGSQLTNLPPQGILLFESAEQFVSSASTHPDVTFTPKSATSIIKASGIVQFELDSNSDAVPFTEPTAVLSLRRNAVEIASKTINLPNANGSINDRFVNNCAFQIRGAAGATGSAAYDLVITLNGGSRNAIAYEASTSWYIIQELSA